MSCMLCCAWHEWCKKASYEDLLHHAWQNVSYISDKIHIVKYTLHEVNIYIYIYICTYGRTYVCMDGWIDACMNACIHMYGCEYLCMAVFPRYGGSEFHPRLAHDDFSVPMWVIWISLCQCIKSNQQICISPEPERRSKLIPIGMSNIDESLNNELSHVFK